MIFEIAAGIFLGFVLIQNPHWVAIPILIAATIAIYSIPFLIIWGIAYWATDGAILP